jgi:hypothetical protein
LPRTERRAAAGWFRWNATFAHPDAYHELGSDLAFPKLRARVGWHVALGTEVHLAALTSVQAQLSAVF